MRFNRSADSFPRKGGNWLTSSGNNDHRIVHLVKRPLSVTSKRRQKRGFVSTGGIYVWDGNTMTPLPDRYDSVFFRPHVFYGNDKHQLYASGISYRPIGLRFMSDADDEVETFFIDPKQWKVAGVWEDTEFDSKDWHSHASKQDMKKIFDDWSLPRNVDRTPGKPNKWVFNEASPNRWPGIKIDGTDHSIWLGDDRSVKQMLFTLKYTLGNAYDAINSKIILS